MLQYQSLCLAVQGPERDFRVGIQIRWVRHLKNTKIVAIAKSVRLELDCFATVAFTRSIAKR
jgi:hypothetical protein